MGVIHENQANERKNRHNESDGVEELAHKEFAKFAATNQHVADHARHDDGNHAGEKRYRW